MSLKNAFKKAVLGTLGAATFVIGGDALVRDLVNPVRGLTSDEIQKAKEVYGSYIDYDQVKIVDGRVSLFQPSSRQAMVPGGSTIYWPGFKGLDQFNADLFIHELGHVFQNQNDIKNSGIAGAFHAWMHSDHYDDNYHPVFDANKKLSDYNIEQQAVILEKYNDALFQIGDEGKKLDINDSKLNTFLDRKLNDYHVLKSIIEKDMPGMPDHDWVSNIEQQHIDIKNRLGPERIQQQIAAEKNVKESFSDITFLARIEKENIVIYSHSKNDPGKETHIMTMSHRGNPVFENLDKDMVFQVPSQVVKQYLSIQTAAPAASPIAPKIKQS